MNRFEKVAEKLLALAGIKINGDRPWDIRVHNQKFYRTVLIEGSLGLGESYMDGWWDCELLDEFINRVLGANLDKKLELTWGTLLQVFIARIFNLQNETRSLQVGAKHFDLDNELFVHMLDKRMNYSCGYWKDAQTLDEAQEAKLDLICKKLRLQPGMKVLDIGCGWGNFAKFAAERYKVKVTGISVSKKGIELATKFCKGLPVEFRLQDYRDLNTKDKYDAVVSVGMFEGVGYKNYRTFMQIVHRCLNDDGSFLLHTIGNNYSKVSIDPWMGKYIFPTAMIPSIKQIGTSIENLFIMEDWHNFGPHYDKTLMAWYRNFDKNWSKIKSKYDDRFYRMWKYYLLSCAGAFRARKLQLWQIVLCKNGLNESYLPIR